ncbi:hypothetical protein MW887_007213 [Aspergillus wentii]|nr:hypothetical protein MW887_007213 [Aspergillus wentii]
MPSVRIAACHVSPVFLSAKDTTKKAISLIEEAAKAKANLIVFPESFIPAFPIWSAIRSPAENHDLFKQMAIESIYADGDEVNALRNAAQKHNIIISIGISEKVRCSSATLFNSNLIIGSDGEVLVHHRKLMPTFFEKLVWAPGDGYGLNVVDTGIAKIGNLICGENTNPLARYALMAQGEQIHISTWPAIWPTRLSQSREGEHANESSGNDNYDNVAANKIRAAAHCFEGKCFGVLCAGALGNDAIEAIASKSSTLRHTMEQSQRGATMFLDPTGRQLPAFTVNYETGEQQATDLLQHTEGILYADINVEDCIEGKQYHDVVGGYQRLDVFDLKVDRTRRHPVTWT